jgi:type IV secretion system protein TrbL
MGGTGVVDRFLDVFTRYIDSGFGLLSGEVAFIATTLIVIDVTLAALFWSWGEGDDIIARLVKKTLFVGVFAYIIGNWNALARIVFESFAGLGLKASGTGFTAAELLQPGRVAQVGLDAGRPILDSIAELMGFVSFFENFIQIVVLLFAWAIVLLAFFVLAIQLFITLIEFKLTTLCGFVLIPFGLFGKTAFMAERVLGNVISSGIKVLVLAVIVGIGSTLFAEFATAIGPEPTIEDAMAVVLASLCLLGLGIFGPGIASGIVSGGPQLGAGAAAGTALAAGGLAIGAAAGAKLAGGAVASAASATAHGGAKAAGGATMAYSLGSAGKTGPGAVASGLGAVGQAAGGAATSPLRKSAEGLQQSFKDGARGAISATGGKIIPAPGAPPPADTQTASGPASANGPPPWAKAMKDRQAILHSAQIAAHTLKSGDGGGAGTTIDTSAKE